MKKFFNGIVAVIIIFLYATSAQATLISFNPGTQSVNLGNAFSIDLTISGLGDYTPDSLGAYDLDILFDPTIISFQSVTFGSGLDIWSFGANLSDASLNSPGALNIFELSFDTIDDLNNYQPGSFTLATLNFGTLTAGTSFLNISINDLSDATGYVSLSSDITNGSIIVSSTVPVPEPATLLLITTGLAGIGILRKRTI